MIQSIGKAFMILDLIGHRKEIGIAEMVNELRWKKSTVHRLASTLEQLGYLYQDPLTMKYRLSFKLYTLGNLTKIRLNLHSAALPFLQKLQADTDESVYLGVVDLHEIVYVEHLPSRHLLQPLIQNGFRAPLYCTAIGKVLLSHVNAQEARRLFRSAGLKRFTPNTIASLRALEKALSEVRNQGFALDNEEYHIGIRSIAAPIKNESGEIIAAASIAGPTSRLGLDDLKKMSGLLKRATESIGLALQGSYPGAVHGFALGSPRKSSPTGR